MIFITSLTKPSKSSTHAQIQPNRLTLRLRSRPWLYFKSKNTRLSQFKYFFQVPAFGVFGYFPITTLFQNDVMPSDHKISTFQYIQQKALETQYYTKYLVFSMRPVNVFLSAIEIVQFFKKNIISNVTNGQVTIHFA